MSDQSCDVAIVGAGPAGLAAAQVLHGHGLRVAVIDEQPRAGGQILRQPPATFTVDQWLTGRLYARVRQVLNTVQDRADIDWRLGTTVLGIFPHPDFRATAGDDAAHPLWLHGPEGSGRLTARAVLIASGCYERPLAFPGWTLPGVMGAGAIQGFVKSQQFVPGKRFVLAGSHPLQLVVADQLVNAGAEIAAVVFTQPMSVAATALRHPLVVMSHRRQFLETARILRRLRRARVPVIFGHTLVRVEGDARVERAVIAPVGRDGAIDRNRAEVLSVDCVGVCHGFLASSELARQAGAEVRWRGDEGGWVVDHDEWFEASVPGLFVAGEVTAIAGADAALEKGRVAGAGILRALGRINDAHAHRLAAPSRRTLARLGEFAALLGALARPPPGLADAVMSENATLCRCEAITRGSFERRLQENPHIVSADAAKLLTRVGMGLCQGRLCGDNAARLITLLRGVPMETVGAFQVQAPVKPVPVEAISRGRCG